MDNASKALIMAGAILLAIALVGLGVYLFSSASDVAETSVDEFANLSMQMKFTDLLKYEGTSVSQKKVKALAAKISIMPESMYTIDVSEVNSKTGMSLTQMTSAAAGTYNITVTQGTDAINIRVDKN